eukprot:Polyplicarium_translucidae@DN2775_c0_g2_i1.p1
MSYHSSAQWDRASRRSPLRTGISRPNTAPCTPVPSSTCAPSRNSLHLRRCRTACTCFGTRLRRNGTDRAGFWSCLLVPYKHDMARAVSSSQGAKIYCLSAGKSTPQFIQDALKSHRSLKGDENYRRRLELIHGMEFPLSCGKVRISKDGEHVAASGMYPPEVKVFDVHELGQKFSRRLDSEVLDFHFLTDDYRKMVFLMSDRGLEFHAAGGRHHRIRVPKPCQSFQYIEETAELYIVGSVNEVYRIDAEQGVFEAPLPVPVTSLLFCAANRQSWVGFWDFRDPRRTAATLTVPGVGGVSESIDATCGSFSSDGLHACIGTSDGECLLYDIRSSQPLGRRNHRNGLPIKELEFVQQRSGWSDEDGCSIEALNTLACSGPTVASCDAKSVKLWSLENTSTDAVVTPIASIESEDTLNGLCLVPSTGVLFTAADAKRIGTFFVPRLGLAPRWASFLDGLTEELEEKTDTTVYDDLQFLTPTQLAGLEIEHLTSTSLLRPYMHGYFMSAALYDKLRSVSEPKAIEDYWRDKIKKRTEERRRMRVPIKKKPPKVNASLADRLTETARIDPKKGKTRKAAKDAQSILSDSRFAQIFSNPDFAIAQEGGD